LPPTVKVVVEGAEDEVALIPVVVVAHLIREAVVPLTLEVVARSMRRLAEDHISPQVAVSSPQSIALHRSVDRTSARNPESLVLGQRRFIPARA
jgi:hypothetical protein